MPMDNDKKRSVTLLKWTFYMVTALILIVVILLPVNFRQIELSRTFTYVPYETGSPPSSR